MNIDSDSDKPFFINIDQTVITYRQFSQDISSIYHQIPSNKVIALIFKSKYLFTVALVATWLKRSTALPISKHETVVRINEIKNNSGCDTVLDDNFFQASNHNGEKTSDAITYKIEPEQELLIISSSGSSGEPKAILLSAKALYYSALGTNQFYQINSSDRWPLTLPLNHIGGIMIIVRAILANATIIDFDSTIDFKIFMKRFSPTTLSLVPTQLIRIISDHENIKQIKKCKRILLGGAKTPRWAIERAINHQIPISITYGSSEMCSQISATVPLENQTNLDSSGIILPYRSVSISSNGKIIVSGDTLFSGIIQNGKLEKVKTPFITNDIGRIKDNELFITGRADDVSICGGENISPLEIENEIVAIAGVNDAKVIFIPDKVFGEIPLAFIDCNPPLNFATIQDKLLTKLPLYKLPHFFAKMPRSSTLKITKQLLIKRTHDLFGQGFPYIKSVGDPNKKTIILIHGFMGNLTDWRAQVDILKNEFHLLLIDLPGHGRSYREINSDSKSNLNLNFEEYVKILHQIILDWCGENKKPIILGYSMGGRVALGISTSYPDFYHKTIIESADPGIIDSKMRVNRAAQDQAMFDKIIDQSQFLNFLDQWYKMLLFGTLNPDEVIELTNSKKTFDYINWKKFSSLLSVGNQPSLWHKLEKIQGEAIYISGEQDKKYTQIGKELPKNFKHIIVEGVGHNTHFLRPFSINLFT